MSTNDQLNVEQNKLVAAWKRVLPTTMNSTDAVTVQADEADPSAVRIHVATAGHSMYTFDFKCTYVDSREVKVELVDVEKAGQTVDERGPMIQELTGDYVRNIHECAQALHELTHA
ncbi:hypothetical protein [Gorillibacterium sp. sgz5001074]|uniref:hypothetical protein n=1 Tax=Gorillibacterium sp. sgz5001074 TaxID=3446695 RepID=UPI003F66EB2A